MKHCVVVCLVSLYLFSAAVMVCARVLAEESSPFTLAERIGEPNERSFFLFSTSAGNYAIRHDGMGEFTSPAGMRKVIRLKIGSNGRIRRLYFLEYEGDLLLLYEAGDSGYLTRINQKTRKVKWVKPVDSNFAPPAMKEHELVFSDGTVIEI